MSKPITPLVGCDAFITDGAGRVLLVLRSDNQRWGLPGGCQNLGETPIECVVRECREETGYDIRVTRLLGVFSSTRYEYVTYPWKDNEFTHLLFHAKIAGGEPRTSAETLAVQWFFENDLRDVSDGHLARIELGFKSLRNPSLPAHFE